MQGVFLKLHNMKTFLTILISMCVTFIFAQTQEDYNRLMQQYIECCTTPQSYGAENVIQPTAKGTKDPCVVPKYNTQLVRIDNEVYRETTTKFTIYAIKVKAINENSISGGLLAGMWTTRKFGKYVASVGWVGVFSGIFYSLQDAQAEQKRLEDLGFCNTTIYSEERKETTRTYLYTQIHKFQ